MNDKVESRHVHTFDLGDRVWVFQMSVSKGLLIEGRAWITELVDDVDEYYVVRFDNEPGETYQRFVDRDGQENAEAYVRAFNKKIGIKVKPDASFKHEYDFKRT